MEELKKIYELLEDASTAIMIFRNTIEITDKQPFFKLHAEDEKALFFIDTAYDLVKKYNIRDSVDPDEIQEAEKGSLIASGWIEFAGEDISIMLENLLFQLDKDGRLAVIRKLIRNAKVLLFLHEVDMQLISCMCGFISYGSKERFIDVEDKGRMSFDELSNLIASLVIVSTQFLFHLGTNCIDFGIGSAAQLVKEIFPDEYEGINFDIFDKETECLQKLEPSVISKAGSKLKKQAIAKATEQVDVIRTLFKSAGVEYNNDTKLSEFIEWLCGGSAGSIRKNALVPNVGFENEDVLKERFLEIGIKYSKGKIE